MADTQDSEATTVQEYLRIKDDVVMGLIHTACKDPYYNHWEAHHKRILELLKPIPHHRD